MGMGIVSNDDFEKELERSQVPEIKITIEDKPTRGREEGETDVPNSLRKIIGETSQIEGRQSALDLADAFGISKSSVSAYNKGATSTTTYNKRPNLDHINEAKERISKKARRVLIGSINAITTDKLQDAKPEVLASVARNMSAIVKDMEPETEQKSEKQMPQFVFYSPQIRDERSYEITIARDNA